MSWVFPLRKLPGGQKCMSPLTWEMLRDRACLFPLSLGLSGDKGCDFLLRLGLPWGQVVSLPLRLGLFWDGPDSSLRLGHLGWAL